MIEVSNEEFLKNIFGADYGRAHVCSFPDDPMNIANDRRAICWGGGSFGNTYINTEENTYFCVSLFRKDDQGKSRRRKILFDQTYIIVADDVKEKLPVERVSKLPAPTYKLATSPGSEQWAWVLDAPCDDREKIENLLDGLVTQGLAPDGTDPGMRGVTRYVRLPEGLNTKAKRVDANFGLAPRCRLLEWSPEVRVSLSELAAPFGIDLEKVRRDSCVDGAALVVDHPLIKSGLLTVKAVLSDGRYDITCPFLEDHTDQADDGTAVFTNADGSIGFCCHHGHCENKTGRDLVEWIEEQRPGFTEELKTWQIMRSFKAAILPDFMSGVSSGDSNCGGCGSGECSGVAPVGVVDTFLDVLSKCSTEQQVIDLAGTARLDVGSFWRVEKEIQARIIALGGARPPVSAVRGMLKAGWNGSAVMKIPEWAVGWCYLTHQAMYYNGGSGETIKQEAFNTAYMCEVGDDSLPSKLLASSGVIPIFWNQMYLPGADREFTFEGSWCINSFKGYPNEGEVEKVAGDDDRIWEMVVAHAQSRYPVKWFVLLDYIAWCVQNPGKKVLWMPILQGVPGDGKSYWGMMMQYVLGSGNVTQISTNEIQSNYSDWAVGGMFGIIEEIRIAGSNRFETVDKLKPYITNDYVNVLPKGLRGYTAPNVMNYLALTNHKDAVPVDENDRRFFPFFSRFQCADDLENGGYFKDLYDQTLHRDSGAAVRRKLMERKIGEYFTHWQRPVIEGDTDREEMIELTKSELSEALDQYIIEGGILNTRVIKQTFDNPMSEYNVDRCTNLLIKREMSSRGYKSGVTRIGNKIVRIWAKD